MEPDWGVVIAKAYAKSEDQPRYPKHATDVQIAAAERALGVPIPTALRSLLERADGVALNRGTKRRRWLVWNLKLVMKEHGKSSRAKVGPPPSFLVFTDELVGYDLSKSTDKIWRWDPTAKKATLVASSLEAFIGKLGRGAI